MKVLTTVVAGFYCTPNFKAQDFGFLRKNLLNSGFHKQKVSRFRNRDSITWGKFVLLTWPTSVPKKQKILNDGTFYVYFTSLWISKHYVFTPLLIPPGCSPTRISSPL